MGLIAIMGFMAIMGHISLKGLMGLIVLISPKPFNLLRIS